MSTRTEKELAPFLGASTQLLNVAGGLLSQLRNRTGPNKPHQLDNNGRLALPAIASLLACEKLQMQDLDLKTAQRYSNVAPKHFNNALTICRIVISQAASRPGSPATNQARTPTHSSPGGPAARSSPASASRSRAQVSFLKLARESLEDEHLPQKVIEWAEIVKQRLRDEEGVAKIVNLDGDEETRGIWGWVVQAWGIKQPLPLPTGRLAQLLVTHLSDLRLQIKAASPFGRSVPPSRSATPTKPRPATNTTTPITPPSRSNRALHIPSENATASSSKAVPAPLTRTTPTNPTHPHSSSSSTAITPPRRTLHPATPSTTIPEPRTPTKQSHPPSSSAAPTPKSTASRRMASHTPSGAGSPLKRQVRRDETPDPALPEEDEREGEKTPTAGAGSRSCKRTGTTKRKYSEDDDQSDEDELLLAGKGDKKGKDREREVMLEPGPGSASAKKAAVGVLGGGAKRKGKGKASTRRPRKSYIDGVEGGEEAVERGWRKYLQWREVQLGRLVDKEGEGGEAMEVDEEEEDLYS